MNTTRLLSKLYTLDMPNAQCAMHAYIYVGDILQTNPEK